MLAVNFAILPKVFEYVVPILIIAYFNIGRPSQYGLDKLGNIQKTGAFKERNHDKRHHPPAVFRRPS